MKNSILIVFLLVVLSAQSQRRLVIVHTNDTHSQVEPTANSCGGVVARKHMIDSIRAKYPDEVLLLDAGDFVQGSPYFNLFEGEVEVQSINRLGYDVVTLGNHEFDNGVDKLHNMLKDKNFEVVCCNYDVSNTVLKDIVKPYTIIERGGIRIGVIGVGVNPTGLISKKNFEGITFLDPVKSANAAARHLKDREECEYIIVLSHTGYNDDRNLAANSININLIIGGHSHTLLERGERVSNMYGKAVPITQVGDKGEYIGVIEVKF